MALPVVLHEPVCQTTLAARTDVIFVDATKSIDSKYFNEEQCRHENYSAVAELVRSKFKFIAEYGGSRIYISK